MQIDFAGHKWRLLPERALLHEESRSLFIADLHLGKVQHFRKHGLALSPAAALQDYQNLDQLIKTYLPSQLFILGDLFHSVHNNEWPLFAKWRSKHEDLPITLIIGNHDIISKHYYHEANLATENEGHRFFEVMLFHHPTDSNETVICGHLHPGVKLKGMGRQQMVLPAFAISKNQLILPAFGSLTGRSILSKQKHWRRFAIVSKEVIEI